jgi:hypothetical protein
MESTHEGNRGVNQPYAVACWLLAALFALRVLGQGLQQFLLLPFLPPASAFQGSGIPYPLLLAVQLAILYAMLRATIRLQHGATAPRRRLGVAFGAFGALYMAVALGRIAVGLGVPEAHAWFRTWIPAAFHVVLAGFVLTLAAFHLVRAEAK